MAENYKSITGKEYSKFIESPTRPGESAVEVVGTVYVADSEPGSPAFWSASNTTNPGIEKVILTDTLANPTFFWSCAVVCRQEASFKIKVNGVVVGSGRTGAAMPNASFSWNPRRNFASGDIFEITIKSRTGSPIVDCEAYLMALTQP